MASDEVRGSDATIPIPPCIRFFKKGKDNQRLVAAVDPNSDFPLGIAVETVRKWILDQGCDGWLIDDGAIAQLSREVNRLEKTKEYFVAEQKDCRIEVQISPDRLRASVSISRAFGGVPLTEDLFRQALEERGICFGINEDRMQQILQEGECERELIAEGKNPVPGENVRFEQLVQESEHKGVPQERADGRVDYKDLGLIISVTPGTPLLKRIPPTTGIPGTGVDGSAIPAPHTTDRMPHPGPGTVLSEDNPDLIVAARAGQPSFFDNSARVDPTLEVESVDPSTGNIDFDGNVIIRGSVEPGFIVKAGQDLTILDTVEGADLIAGKNLVLLTGMYGRGKSKITAEGNLEARFLSDCTVHCGGNIEVSDLIAHCVVECGGILQVGKHGGKGQISGGKIMALREVRAQILGSVSEALTMIAVGPSPALIHRQSKVDEEIIALEQELGNVEKELISIEISPAGREHLGVSLQEKGAVIFQKLGERKKEKEVIREKMEASNSGRIRAAEVHHGVVLSIGSYRQTVSELITDLDFQPPVEEIPQLNQ
jgi:uncharacterized protein